MKYGNKKIWPKVIASPITFILLLLFFAFTVRAVWTMSRKSRASDNRLTAAQAALADLENQKAGLSDKVAYISTEQGIKSEIRTKFHAAEDGESIAVIVDDSQNSNNSELSSNVSVLSWWRKLLRIFGI